MPEALEELEAEEVTALDLLVNENEDERASEEEEDDSGAEMPTTVEGLQALIEKKNEIISKRNKSLKKAKSAQHRTADENATLQSQFEALEARIDGIGKPNVEAEKYDQEDQEWQDRVAEDPTQAIGYMKWQQSNLENRLSSFLGQKFGEFSSQFADLKNSTNPEKLAYQNDIDQLRQNSKFSELDDDAALAVVKALKSSKVPGRGNIGGGKVAKQPKKKGFELSDDDKRAMGFPV
jgi:hypothetical protein